MGGLPVRTPYSQCDGGTRVEVGVGLDLDRSDVGSVPSTIKTLSSL